MKNTRLQLEQLSKSEDKWVAFIWMLLLILAHIEGVRLRVILGREAQK